MSGSTICGLRSPVIHSFIHSFYLTQAAWPIKHKNTYTYTKHRYAKLKKENKENMHVTDYTTEKSINNVHSIKILHQSILAVMPHTSEYTCTIM